MDMTYRLAFGAPTIIGETRMKRIHAFILVTMFLTIVPVYAQRQRLPPFVSRLTAHVEGATIKLTWQDADEEVERYLVYRHTEEITTENFPEATYLGEAPAEAMTFVDYPPDDSRYYYAVAAVDENGDPYDVFVPYRNKTTTGAAVDSAAIEATLPVAITDIRAEVRERQVVLTFSTSSKRRSISIYRGTQPFNSSADLISAVLIDTIPSSQTEYTDEPVADLDYYYALFDSELLRIGKQRFLPQQNVLSTPVRIAPGDGEDGASKSATTSMRARPLPFLVLSTKIDTGESLGGVRNSLDMPQVVLSPRVAAAVDELTAGTTVFTPISTWELLPEDRPQGAESAQSELAGLIVEHFKNAEWSEARTKLKTYLLTRRPPAAAQRARFYLGQTYYFEQRYPEAFIEFLFASDGYYAASMRWMDTILVLLKEWRP